MGIHLMVKATSLEVVKGREDGQGGMAIHQMTTALGGTRMVVVKMEVCILVTMNPAVFVGKGVLAKA